jgi:hypothetical protein
MVTDEMERMWNKAVMAESDCCASMLELRESIDNPQSG